MNRSPSSCSISQAPSPVKHNLSIQEPRSIWRLRGSKLIPGTAGERQRICPPTVRIQNLWFATLHWSWAFRWGQPREASMSETGEQEKGLEVGWTQCLEGQGIAECAEGGGVSWAGPCTLEKGPLGGLSCTRCTMLRTRVLWGGKPRGF